MRTTVRGLRFCVKNRGWTSFLGELDQLEFSISKKLGQVALLLGQVAKLGWPR